MTSERRPSGIKTDELDPEVRPQDDLFVHVTGKWMKRTAIPADKARYGSFHVLHERAEEAVRDIIEDSPGAEPGTSARKVGDLYSTFMDASAIEAHGLAPIESQIAFASNVASISAVLDAVGRLERHGVG
jgi:putative endopeptidase